MDTPAAAATSFSVALRAIRTPLKRFPYQHKTLLSQDARSEISGKNVLKAKNHRPFSDGIPFHTVC
jgi:hypothetical protein